MSCPNYQVEQDAEAQSGNGHVLAELRVRLYENGEMTVRKLGQVKELLERFMAA